jgi:hypothetical protein
MGVWGDDDPALIVNGRGDILDRHPRFDVVLDVDSQHVIAVRVVGDLGPGDQQHPVFLPHFPRRLLQRLQVLGEILLPHHGRGLVAGRPLLWPAAAGDVIGNPDDVESAFPIESNNLL